MYSKYLFRGSNFFTLNDNHIYLLSFANNPKDVILNNRYSGSIKLNDNKLFITPLQTDNTTLTLNVIFITPTLLRLTKIIELINS